MREDDPQNSKIPPVETCDQTAPRGCERCGGAVRAEHGHFKCDHCGWMTHCCEGGGS